MASAFSYDAVGVSVLASPVASPRARESEFYYTLVFPNTRHSRAAGRTEPERVSYQHAVTLLRAVTSGGKEREKRAVDEFRRAWECKFRCARPAPQDSVPFVYIQELLREVILQRFDAIPGLSFVAHVSADERQLLLSLRPSKALLAATADALKLRVPAAPELDPGERYWAADPSRGQREREPLDKIEVQEELYRLFLAGKLPAVEAQLFEGESAAMWSRRLRALKRFSDPEVAKHLAAPPPLASSTLPFKNHPALQYLYQHIDSATAFSDGDDSAAAGSGGGSPFRVVDKIRLTKAIVDAEFDCDALVAQRVLSHHLCAHTHHTDGVDTSVDVLRFQWGSLLSPWRLYRQGLVGLLQALHSQPLVHVRNYFGEEIALYFAYTSFYTQWLQRLCVAVAVLALLQSWRLGTETAAGSESAGRVQALFAVAFCLANCAFVQLFVRKWAVRERSLASDWGVSDLKDSRQPRPQFRGELERSPVNWRLEPHYSPAMRAAKRCASCVLLLLLSTAILLAYHSLLAAFRGSRAGLQGANALLAVVTKLAGMPLVYVSTRLNDWENYKTQADYDANLTLKFALLQTVNSFGVLWFLTFLRPFLSSDACSEAALQLSCREQAAALLLTMLALDLVLALAELRAPLYDLLCAGAHERVRKFLRARRTRLRKADAQRRTLLGVGSATNTGATTGITAGHNHDNTDGNCDDERPLEAELALAPYEGVMLDYAQVIVNFGFVTWFAALSPAAASVAAWGVAVLQLRADTFKLSSATQRPFPAAKSSLGGWLLYLRFLSLTSLLHNAALAWMLWAECVAPAAQRVAHVHDLLALRPAAPDAQLLLLASETQALALFAVFALVWVLAGLPDQRDRAAAARVGRARQRERFLETKFMHSVERVADAVRAALPPGRVFLNGVHRYVVTGDKAEEDAADEVFDELRRRQLRVLDVERRIAELRRGRAGVGALSVEVVRITILPVVDALTKAVDSFVQLRLQEAHAAEDEADAGGTSAAAAKPANTSVAKKNRSPQWHEKFEFPLASLDDALELSVWDWELLGPHRRIGRTSLLVADVVSRTLAGETEPPAPPRARHASAATDAATAQLVVGTFELPIEMPDELLRSLAAADLVRHGPPRLQLRCGVQLQELGALLATRQRLRRRHRRRHDGPMNAMEVIVIFELFKCVYVEAGGVGHRSAGHGHSAAPR
ncbi:hypothetical protein PybrP1_000847 [[Pythium] brassicae (nom. inval.)]|nr:hypothetical protein PybrP1_000847 [[Pythium] brassicae (nom. inval.)]